SSLASSARPSSISRSAAKQTSALPQAHPSSRVRFILRLRPSASYWPCLVTRSALTAPGSARSSCVSSLEDDRTCTLGSYRSAAVRLPRAAQFESGWPVTKYQLRRLSSPSASASARAKHKERE